MEAATLPKKKPKVSKGKMKRTMKNILCRPDPQHWPEVSNEDAQQIKRALSKHKVEIQAFIKPHWNEIKDLPKSERPRPPKMKKVEGLLFGITTCSQAIPNNSCQVIILEAEINPRIMVQHIVELCTTFSVPLVCLKGLKNISKDTFGFPTSCLAFKKEVKNVANSVDLILKIAEKYKRKVTINKPEEMELEDSQANKEEQAINEKTAKNDNSPFTYLYRNTKETRIFKPPTDNVQSVLKKSFSGQDFIKVPISKQPNKRQRLDKRPFTNMVVKKVANNQNRKRKK